MARPLQLDNFDLPMPGVVTEGMARGEAEDLRLAAYEQGYSAGWDDAVAAQDEEVARLRTDLGRSLREMAVSFEDARSHVLSAIEPLLQEMVTKVLPTVARHSLAPMIIEILSPVADEMSMSPARIVTAPQHRETVERLVSTLCPGMALVVQEEASLGAGQAHVMIGKLETRIDLDGVIEAISRAVSTFFQIENDKG